MDTHVNSRSATLACVAVASPLFAVGCSGPARAEAVHPHIRLVHDHTARFNAHDAEGMRALAAEDIAWYTIEGDQIVPNSGSADAFVEGLKQYFAAIPSVRAELEHVHAAGSYVMVRERVSWTNADGNERSQASYCCYEIRDGKIHAVWYFPAE